LWYQIRSFYRKQKLEGLEVTYDIGPDGIRGQSSQYDSMIRWDGIEAVSAAPGYRFVWLNKLQGLVFPDRCFEGKQQMDEFDRLVRERLGSKGRTVMSKKPAKPQRPVPAPASRRRTDPA
jgi:hypothetical protein